MIENKLKPFWRQDGYDYIADLGEMTTAIVVAKYMGDYYAISPRSYFPFTDAQNKKRFNNYYDCCMYAEQIILHWIKSLFFAEIAQLPTVTENLKLK